MLCAQVCTNYPEPRAMRGQSAIEKAPGGSSSPMVLLEPAGDRGEILMMRARKLKRGRLRRVLLSTKDCLTNVKR
jgi:hypothetical protein